MKVLESQTAVLSNFEVHEHLAELQSRKEKKKRHAPPSNQGMVVDRTLDWLRLAPSPLSQTPTTYHADSIPTLLERLRPYDLTKGELIMILNLRPCSVPALNTTIEDMEVRFTEDQQMEILTIITEVLGQFDPPEETEDAEAVADTSMADAQGS
ncbi:unnamed protein product [Clonostachys byssicola]|uniref:DNA-directed RNA polymerase III subunit RPC9 n=1 Tax=Clonostachys byssicola TaxID=160290 RepID=A0A9N9U8G7_9HYPO|nr:unnamed protein product [Clonostachys byssicola]